jgi:hypothetical protein
LGNGYVAVQQIITGVLINSGRGNTNKRAEFTLAGPAFAGGADMPHAAAAPALYLLLEQAGIKQPIIKATELS